MMRHVAANVLTLLVLGMVLVFGIVTWGQSQFRGPGPLEAPLRIEVARGEGLASVADRLQEAGAISNASVFRIGARYAGLDSGVRYGEYEFPPGISMQGILDQLNAGGNVLRQVVIPEGWTSWQVVEALRAHPDLSGEIAEVPPEGSLAPAGYDYQRGDPRQAILDRMRTEQDKALAEAWAARDPDLPIRTPEELLVLASIVEKETGVTEERGRVAGVFVNRLKRGMRLQTDPTVIYGITKGRETLGRGLRASELAASTPFNTYVIGGLPPTPIANPGRASLMAAARPEQTDFLYFVADGSGGHVFARTLEEHNANVNAWRRLEAQRALEAEQAGESEQEGQEGQ
ncbi:endolytic transglycosylase MltG [Amaricoccus sp.]|uniref:endolytic transglycosylase MltG n=1 Tax=Amaricoccus sp. TaxID=1872485 RepID=UPI001B46373C|nr:endolytic transglycosylase MltG [Amaricoccus sp.]MBP7242598.1 endolytic transglycosylase MltG [Amaricoccus sp.]